MSWACNAVNRTATKANPGNKSPYEMWHGSPPPAGEVLPFLKPAIYRVKRENKSLPKAQDCYYIGLSVNHPRHCMQMFTTHRTILTTRNVTCQHVPTAPPGPQQYLPPIAEEGNSTAGEGASSQGGKRLVDMDSESDLDMTGVGPVLPATRNAPAAEAGAGTGGVAEVNPPAPSAPSRRAEIGSANNSSNSKDDRTSRRGNDSNASHTSIASSSTSGSGSSEDITDLTGTEARRLQNFGKSSEPQSGRTRSQSWGWTSSESCTDTLLAYARTEAEEAEETERVHDLLLEEHLEVEREWLDESQDWFEGRWLRVKQREEEQGPDCLLAMAAERQSELSIPSPIGKKTNEVESPPHYFAGVERSVYTPEKVTPFKRARMSYARQLTPGKHEGMSYAGQLTLGKHARMSNGCRSPRKNKRGWARAIMCGL